MITIKDFSKGKSTFRSIFCRNMFEDMWIDLLCGLVIYGVWKQFLSDDTGVDDSHLAETFSSHAAVLFTVADRLKKLYCGKVFVGLNIPDTVSASRQNIDIVLVTDREVVVVSVQNVSGLVSVDEKDGSWTCTSSGDTHRHHKSEKNRLPDPVAQAKRQVSILESYLEQRGLELPEGYLSFKVICPNSTFSFVGPSSYTHEVITYDQWSLLKPESKSMLSGWIKGALSWKKDSQNSWHEKLNQILTTAPIWDRIELKGNKLLLGEFVEFKGKHEDVQELRHVKRSKVGRVIIQKTSMFGLAPSKLQVVYYPRDYRREGSSSLSEWNEVTVKANTEVLFQPQNSDKVRKFKLSSVTSLSLSA